MSRIRAQATVARFPPAASSGSRSHALFGIAAEDAPVIVPVANGRILAKLIPDARLVTLDDGHVFLITNAKQSAKFVSEFLS